MVAFFFILPLITLALCLVKDHNNLRRWILNIILMANLVLYLFPLAYAWYYSLPDGNMWSENESGAVLWFYFYIIPVCLIVLVVVAILKWIFRKKSG